MIATDRDGGNDGLLKYYLVTNSTVYAVNKGTGEVLLNQEPVFTTKRDAQQGEYITQIAIIFSSTSSS